jgi:hypothetical protein
VLLLIQISDIATTVLVLAVGLVLGWLAGRIFRRRR